MNQTEFLTSTCDLLKSLETLSAQCPIEFGFSFHLLKKLDRDFSANYYA